MDVSLEGPGSIREYREVLLIRHGCPTFRNLRESPPPFVEPGAVGDGDEVEAEVTGRGVSFEWARGEGA
jgi:hypothetical protein